MDPGFRENQGYYGSERDSRHQPQQQQHQLPQQPAQLLPHYVHQLPQHLGLLPTHLQQHHAQSAYVMDQSEHMRRHSGPTNVELQHLLSGSGQATPSAHHSNVLMQYAAAHSQPLQQPSDHTAQAGYVSPSSEQPPTMIDTSTTGQAFISPDSPTHLDDGTERVADNREQAHVEMEITNLDPDFQGRVFSSEKNTPKKRAMRLALAETQQNKEQSGILREQNLPIPNIAERQQNKEQTGVLREQNLPIPNIWKPDLPGGLSLKFSQDGRKITGVRSERMMQKGAKFGPYNGRVVDEHIGSVKDSAWEICIRGACLYLEGQNKSHNNWMAFIESANFPEEQNLEAFQSYGDIYFRTTKVIDPGSELKVFYNEEYASRAGFKRKLNELLAVYEKDTRNFKCSACDRTYPSAKSLLRHVKISHEPDRANEMLPVLTWKRRNALENEESKKLPRSPSPPSRPKLRVKLKNVKSPVNPAKSNALALKKREVRTKTKDIGDDRFICLTCGKTFPTQGRLAAHETFHEDTPDLTCKTCGETLSSMSNYAEHMVTHKEEFVCSLCGNVFATKNNVIRHQRLSHKYKCRVCEMKFVKKGEYDRHEETHPDLKYVDGDVEVEEQEEEEAVENSSLSKDMLGKPVNYFDKPHPFKCRYCPKRYVSRTTRLVHESERHTKQCRYKCEQCPSVFTRKYRYVEHMKRHITNRPFQCPICPATFASESALNNHQGEHTGLKPVKCEECGKGFRTRKFMNAHKRRMHKVQQMRFACSFCNKPFYDKGSLVKHERRHKGIRPFVCLVCGRGFTSNYCLISHSYTHTKEKKFGCPKCDEKFTLNQNLMTHIYKVHTTDLAEQALQTSK